MDGWLKALVAAACVVVLAGGGLYFYRDQQASAASDEAQREACIKTLSQVILGTSAEPEDQERARQLKACERNGLLSPEMLGHIEASRLADYYRTL